MPEQNYYRDVWGSLVDLVASARGVSEKAFTARDEIHTEIDSLLRTSDAMEIIDRFENGSHRSGFCAELIFSRLEGV